MTDTIKVRAVKDEHILVLSHPHGPPLTKDGALWPYDGFTCRLLAENAIERVSEPAQHDAEQPAVASPAPAVVKTDAAKLPPVPNPTAR